MEHVVVYRKLDQFTSKRPGETKLGEVMQVLGEGAELASSTAHFVVFGVPEDLGPRANLGRGGATSAWTPVLSWSALPLPWLSTL